MHVVKLPFHRYKCTVIYKKLWKLQNSNISSAEVCQGVLGHNCSIDFLPDAKNLSAVKSLHSLTFLVRLHGHIHNHSLGACTLVSVKLTAL